MHLRRNADRIEVWAPAKVNLFLKVLAKRPDGFHEIETLMCPVDLYDTLTVVADDHELSLDCVDARRDAALGQPLPSGPDNLVLRAAERLRAAAGGSQGARLRLVKRIPLAAGLAGGSSDAAATLMALNLTWQLNWSRERLAEVAAELGSDVPFFLQPGSAVCRGRGERIEPLDRAPTLDLVIAFPHAGLSTAAVYGGCQPSTSGHRVEPLVEAWRQGRSEAWASRMHNSLQAPAERLSTEVGRLREEFARLGCVAHQMSGSGTSYFGICRSRREARRLAARVGQCGRATAYAVRSCG